MKKMLFRRLWAGLAALAACMAAGCEPPYYTGDNEDFYSIVGLNIPVIAGSGFNLTAEAIESDGFGRTLFSMTVPSKYYIVGICQFSDGERFGYYEDRCCRAYIPPDAPSEAELAELKEENDWGGEIDLSKTTALMRDRAFDYDISAASRAFAEETSAAAGEYTCEPFCSDAKGRWIYLVTMEQSRYFAVLDAEGAALRIERAEDTVDCREQLIRLKGEVGWEPHRPAE